MESFWALKRLSWARWWLMVLIRGSSQSIHRLDAYFTLSWLNFATIDCQWAYPRWKVPDVQRKRRIITIWKDVWHQDSRPHSSWKTCNESTNVNHICFLQTFWHLFNLSLPWFPQGVRTLYGRALWISLWILWVRQWKKIVVKKWNWEEEFQGNDSGRGPSLGCKDLVKGSGRDER